MAWSYFTLTVKNPDVKTLNGKLNALGAEGWELVSALSTVKTWANLSGNDLVLLFKAEGLYLSPNPKTIEFVAGGVSVDWTS